jgi:hypothetical protein
MLGYARYALNKRPLFAVRSTTWASIMGSLFCITFRCSWLWVRIPVVAIAIRFVEENCRYLGNPCGITWFSLDILLTRKVSSFDIRSYETALKKIRSLFEVIGHMLKCHLTFNSVCNNFEIMQVL